MKKIKLDLWDLPIDLLRLIFKRLSLVDLVRAGAVAKTWHDLWRSCLPQVLEKPRTPWLMSIPMSTSGAAVCMMNLGENKRSYTIRGLGKVCDSRIVGCSNGWLVLCGREAIPHLFNRFTRTRISLPPIEGLKPGLIQRVRVDYEKHIYKFVVTWGKQPKLIKYPETVVDEVIKLAIVMVDDRNKVNGVFVGLPISISYWRRGNERWFSMNREIGLPLPWYILFEDNKLYVLTSLWNVEVWDFSNGTPQRKRDIINSGPHPEFSNSLGMIPAKRYMVRVGAGELVIAARFFRYYTNGNRIIRRKDSWEFYKVRDRSLGEQEHRQAFEGYAVFLGQNAPIALLAEQVSGCRDNSIYYTPDFRVSKPSDGCL